MPKSKAKRAKAYKGRHINIPVMPELQREFLFAGHGALASMRLAPSIDAFDQLASVFNVVHVALTDQGGNSILLESGLHALQAVADRIERTGVVAIGKFELRPVELAMAECEEVIKTLDVMGLYFAQRKIRVAQAAQIQM